MKFIGIAGPSGSGKSTLRKTLGLDKDYQPIRLDNYFKNPKSFPKKFGFRNWEKPSNIKFDALLRDMKALKEGKTVHTKSFPKKAGGKSQPIILKPKKFILVEGFILFTNRKVRDLLDIKIYLDIPAKLMLRRRAIRFGADHVTEYDNRVAIPEYLKSGVKQKSMADYVINAAQPQAAVIAQVKSILKKYGQD